jgi:hypothetical protein
MSHWRIVEILENPQESDLTDSELIGVSVLLTHRRGEPRDEWNVYWRARQKIQPQVETALTRED